MVDYVYRWSCVACTTSFLLYTEAGPEACPYCGRTKHSDSTKFNKIREMKIETHDSFGETEK